MKQTSLLWISTLLACAAGPSATYGHTPYGKALKEQYDLRTVSCYACHVKGKDEETGKPLGKEHLNDFGTALHAVLKDKNFTEKIEAAKELPREERSKVDDEAEAEFLKAMEQIGSKSAADSEKTWMQLIQGGELEGIRLRE